MRVRIAESAAPSVTAGRMMSLQSKRPEGASQRQFDGEDVNQHRSDHETRQTDAEQCDHGSEVIGDGAVVGAREDAEWYGDHDRDEHREDRELDRRGIAFEYEFAHGAIVAKRETHVAAQECAPIIDVTVIGAVPGEVAVPVCVFRERKEKRRTIEPVLFAKLLKLFGSGLFAQNGDRGITGNEFD